MPRAIRFASSGEVSATRLVPGAGPVDSLSAHGATSPPESPSELAAFRKSLDRFARYGCVISFDRRERDLSDRVRDVPTSEPARNEAASPSASARVAVFSAPGAVPAPVDREARGRLQGAVRRAWRPRAEER